MDLSKSQSKTFQRCSLVFQQPKPQSGTSCYERILPWQHSIHLSLLSFFSLLSLKPKTSPNCKVILIMIIEKERKKKKDELVWVNLYLTLAINKTEQGSSSILTVPGPQQWASSTPQFCRNKTPNLMTIVVTDIININVCKVLQNCNTFTGQVYCPLKYSKTIH